MRGRLTSEDFVHYGSLYMCPPGCEVFPFHIIKHKFYQSNVILRTVNDPTSTVLKFLQFIFQLLSTSIQ